MVWGFLGKLFGGGSKTSKEEAGNAPRDTENEENPDSGSGAEGDDGTEGVARPRNHAKPKLVGGTSRILTIGDLIWMNMSLPLVPRATTWSAVFLSHRDGKSFSKMIHSLKRTPNTLILVKDDGGHIFGLFACDEWKEPADLEEEFKREKARAQREARLGRKYDAKKSTADVNFYGEGNCALVGISPVQRVYRPTKINENYQYLQTSYPQADLNGLAMGGLPGLFGVQIDSYLDTGKFRGAGGKCMTFNNPCLAHREDFRIEECEVWVLSDREVEAAADTGTSILQNKEAKADKEILELHGKKFYADMGDE